jgi:hypothetical protein
MSTGSFFFLLLIPLNALVICQRFYMCITSYFKPNLLYFISNLFYTELILYRTYFILILLFAEFIFITNLFYTELILYAELILYQNF